MVEQRMHIDPIAHPLGQQDRGLPPFLLLNDPFTAQDGGQQLAGIGALCGPFRLGIGPRRAALGEPSLSSRLAILPMRLSSFLSAVTLSQIAAMSGKLSRDVSCDAVSVEFMFFTPSS